MSSGLHHGYRVSASLPSTVAPLDTITSSIPFYCVIFVISQSIISYEQRRGSSLIYSNYQVLRRYLKSCSFAIYSDRSTNGSRYIESTRKCLFLGFGIKVKRDPISIDSIHLGELTPMSVCLFVSQFSVACKLKIKQT